MKLRYLKVGNYPPLNNIAIQFSTDSPLNRECAIRFVVGVNGSGKTHLLQALMEVFVGLADQKPPRFPVTLIYDLGIGKTQRTLIFDHPGDGGHTGWWQSKHDPPGSFSNYAECDWQELVSEARSGTSDWEA